MDDLQGRLQSQVESNGASRRTSIHLSNLCTEITEVSSQPGNRRLQSGLDQSREARQLGRTFDFEKLGETVRAAVKFLDRVIDINFYPIDPAADSNHNWRPVGPRRDGAAGRVLRAAAAVRRARTARELSRRIQEEIYFHALERVVRPRRGIRAASCVRGDPRRAGRIAVRSCGASRRPIRRAGTSSASASASIGLRNSLLIAIAPTATIASIVGAYECIEPQVSNLFKRETLSGDFLQINRYLGRRTEATRPVERRHAQPAENVRRFDSEIAEIPEDVRAVYRTAWEIPMRSLIDMAAERGAFIDQSQSLNLFVPSPNIGKLSSMYMYAWKKGLKTTYYLRSRPCD